MRVRTYRHSAYWYAYNFGYTHSDAATYAGQYLDIHTYRPRMRESADGEFRGADWIRWRNSETHFDSSFNPILFGVAIAMDIGVAMRETVRRIADPEERARMKEELRRELRIVRRPFYYARETQRRRELAAARRKITRRSTTAPMPTPEGLLAAWNARKESKEAMIRLGGMLHDLACYVDSALRFDESGNVVGRNSGIRGWLEEHLPELSPKYKTLMRYKAMVIKLRQATGVEDPVPTEKLLVEPKPEVVEKLLEDFRMTFSSLEEGVSFLISPDTVLAGGGKEMRSGVGTEGESGKDVRVKKDIEIVEELGAGFGKRAGTGKGAGIRNGAGIGKGAGIRKGAGIEKRAGTGKSAGIKKGAEDRTSIEDRKRVGDRKRVKSGKGRRMRHEKS